MSKVVQPQSKHDILQETGLKAFQNVKVITFLAIMGAVSVVLGYYTIAIGDFIKIGFSGLPNQIICHLFGPAVAGIFAGLMDIVKYLIKPTGAFFPGFTVSAVLGALIYGFAFWNQKITLLRVFLATLITALVVNVCCNTLWLSILYGKGFLALLPTRILKQVIMVPIDSVITYLVLTRLKGAWKMVLKK